MEKLVEDLERLEFIVVLVVDGMVFLKNENRVFLLFLKVLVVVIGYYVFYLIIGGGGSVKVFV